MARLNVLSTLCTRLRVQSPAGTVPGPAPPSGWKRGEHPVRRRPRNLEGMAGFEPAISSFVARRVLQFPHTPVAGAAGFEPAVSSSTVRRVSRFPTRPASRQCLQRLSLQFRALSQSGSSPTRHSAHNQRADKMAESAAPMTGQRCLEGNVLPDPHSAQNSDFNEPGRQVSSRQFATGFEPAISSNARRGIPLPYASL